MNFFKHFTDSHEGKSVMAIMDMFGHAGYSTYFILLEICAGKLEKSKDEELSEEHCHFTINERLLREKCRLRSTKVRLILDYCSTLDLFSVESNGNELNFYMPKLLEYIDRDSKRARKLREISAPTARLDKDKDKDKDTIAKDTAPDGASVLFSLWNQKASGQLPRARELTPKRRKHANARWHYCKDIAKWEKLIGEINQSPFHLGQGPNGWIADFDYLLRPDTIRKFIEKESIVKNKDNLKKIEISKYDFGKAT